LFDVERPKMSALDVLRQVKQARRAQGNHKTVEWGNADFISGVGIENLTRRELRNHLDARDMEVAGNRLELLGRLRESLADEQLSKFAYKETTDTELLIEAELEERGSVYSIGTNNKGQLGLGDLEKRLHFTAIPQLRGIGVNTVCAGDNVCYVVTEQHDVYVWGGGGAVKTFNASKDNERKSKDIRIQKAKTLNWLEPDLCMELGGEEIVGVAAGSSHYVAASRGGDCLVWGDNDSGQLGLGNFDTQKSVVINSSFPSAIQQVTCGSNHVLVLTADGEIYTWGHSRNGRYLKGSISIYIYIYIYI
jgi:alpha-tubulin suppressor-like RCC1 family protein